MSSPTERAENTPEALIADLKRRAGCRGVMAIQGQNRTCLESGLLYADACTWCLLRAAADLLAALQGQQASLSRPSEGSELKANYQREPSVEVYRCWNCRKMADEQPCEHCGHQNGPPRPKVEGQQASREQERETCRFISVNGVAACPWHGYLEHTPSNWLCREGATTFPLGSRVEATWSTDTPEAAEVAEQQIKTLREEIERSKKC